MIKLYIFESVTDALAFEHPAPKTEPKKEILPKFVPGSGIKESPEPHQPTTTSRKYQRRKKANPEKGKVKERILAKAKSKSKAKGARTCKNCGKTGHMAKTCPEKAPLPPKPEGLTREQMDFIKDLAEEGKTVAEIVMQTGLPSQVVKENMH
ncbi:MAG: hypothetical protein ACREO5_00160 [Candidatus Binatia bacterium]